MDNLNKNCLEILKTYYKINIESKVLIIFDNKNLMNEMLYSSFIFALKKLGNEFSSYNFFENENEKIIEFINNNLKPKDIVILIQSSSFRVSKYRWRNELCDKGLKVLEFNQTSKILENEYLTFIDSLECDYIHQKKIADFLISKIDKSQKIKFVSKNNLICEYEGKMDECLRNIGELWNQTNWSSKFPIGEIISEGLDLSILNGEIEVYAYPKLENQTTKFCEPFNIKIENGFAVSHNGEKEFDKIWKLLKTENEEQKIFVRELGFGLNRFIKNRIGDCISYERQEGLHFSLGMKHGMYQKKLWKKYGKKFHQKFHIDVYVNILKIFIDDVEVYDCERGFYL